MLPSSQNSQYKEGVDLHHNLELFNLNGQTFADNFGHHMALGTFNAWFSQGAATNAAIQHIWTHIYQAPERCYFCRGHGHEYRECPTRAKVDAKMKAAGFMVEWGGIKGALYWRENMHNPDVIQQ